MTVAPAVSTHVSSPVSAASVAEQLPALPEPSCSPAVDSTVSQPVVPSSGVEADPAKWPVRVLAYWGAETLALFRSVPLAIMLIALLAIATLVGVWIPQEGLVDLADIKRQYGASYQTLKAFGLFNVYSSPWYVALEVLFFFNLLLGSFRWLKPATTAGLKRQFLSVSQLQKASTALAPIAVTAPWPVTLEALRKVLKKRGYSVYVQPDGQPDKPPVPDVSINHSLGETRVYATKGWWTRLGPAVAHIGILLLLVASLYGTLTGFKVQHVAVPGETFRLSAADRLFKNAPAGFWLGQVPPWSIRVQDFHVDYYANKPDTPKQYFCTLDVLDANGKPLRQGETISVNHPLTLGNFTIYQASFAPTGKLFLTLNGQPVAVQADQNFNNRPIAVLPVSASGNRALFVFPFYRQQDAGVTDNNVVVFLHNGKQFEGAAPGKMPTNLRLSEGQSGVIAGVKVGYVKPEIATGLQMKEAPETFWMYLAFFIICLGTVMCFPPQRQLWLALAPVSSAESSQTTSPEVVGLLYWLPKTNKGKHLFQQELARLQLELIQCLAPPGPEDQTLAQSVAVHHQPHARKEPK
ncbi:MAG: cytochrome c biogenesis protein ResB [Candidatus Melainabacteria bacterium]|nr:cytochrome c biogenesis protein ResB [Candidatus Melainabacteria bacterium]